MKKITTLFILALACGGTVFAQSRNITGVWASEERSPDGYPLWVFEVSAPEADSLSMKLTSYSENYDAQYLYPVFNVVPDGDSLKFGLSKLQFGGNQKFQKVRGVGDHGVPSEYFGSVESTFLNSQHASALLSMNFFDLDIVGNEQLSGTWYRKTSSISKAPEQRDSGADMRSRSRVVAKTVYSGDMPLTFHRTTHEQLHSDNMALDIQNMKAGGGRHKYLGRYATDLMYSKYGRRLKVADGLRTTGIVLEAAGGTMLAFIAILHMEHGAGLDMRTRGFMNDRHVQACFAVAGVGVGFHITGALLKRHVYKRFLDENRSYFDVDVAPSGLSMSYNF
jgi:hypothetical protein